MRNQKNSLGNIIRDAIILGLIEIFIIVIAGIFNNNIYLFVISIIIAIILAYNFGSSSFGKYGRSIKVLIGVIIVIVLWISFALIRYPSIWKDYSHDRFCRGLEVTFFNRSSPKVTISGFEESIDKYGKYIQHNLLINSYEHDVTIGEPYDVKKKIPDVIEVRYFNASDAELAKRVKAMVDLLRCGPVYIVDDTVYPEYQERVEIVLPKKLQCY